MVYQVKLAKDVIKKDLPNLKKSGINLTPLFDILDKKLKNNPYIKANTKSGDLSNFRAMDWNNGYRVLYKVVEEEKLVIVGAIDSHNNAYRKIKRRKDNLD